MSQPADTDEALQRAALGPKSVTVGNTSATAQNVDEIIKADRYAASKAAAANRVPGFGLRTQVGTPPGCGG